MSDLCSFWIWTCSFPLSVHINVYHPLLVVWSFSITDLIRNNRVWTALPRIYPCPLFLFPSSRFSFAVILLLRATGEWKVVSCCASMVRGRWKRTPTRWCCSLHIETRALWGENVAFVYCGGKRVKTVLSSTFGIRIESHCLEWVKPTTSDQLIRNYSTPCLSHMSGDTLPPPTVHSRLLLFSCTSIHFNHQVAGPETPKFTLIVVIYSYSRSTSGLCCTSSDIYLLMPLSEVSVFLTSNQLFIADGAKQHLSGDSWNRNHIGELCPVTCCSM